MKVLHINANYVTSALHQTMIEHFDKGLDSIVFVPTYDATRCVVTPDPNVILDECFSKWDRIIFHYKQYKIIKAIEDKIKFNSIDCIHAYTLFTDGNVARELSKKHKKPYVVAVRNTDVYDFFKKRFYLRNIGIKVLEDAAAVFFLSPAYYEMVINHIVPKQLRNIVRNKAYIIPNGIDDFWHKNIYVRDAIAVQKKIKETKTVKCIYVGAIDKNKNIELTLRALAELERRGWNCTLTSVGKIVDKKIFDRLKKYDSFIYVEPKSKEQLIDYYRDADIFVMPSHTETFGLVYAEAMSQGLPVIYTRGQGFDGQFEEGDVGHSVSSVDLVELISAIVDISSNYGILSEKCCTYVSRFDWKEICKKYISIYRKILGNNV